MKYPGPLLLFSASLMVMCSSCNQSAQAPDPWPAISAETKPWTRWWWMGSDVDSIHIWAQMEQYARAGFGGLEITPIYGVMGREDHYLEFLSPGWMEMLHTSVTAAKSHGMKVDMNLGTGWPFGGPQITPEHAASRLIMKTYRISAGASFREKILPDESEADEGVFLETLMAYAASGETIELTDRVTDDGTLNWSPEPGNWELAALFCGKTGQMVKRAAPGGEGYTMDHFSAEALKAYLERFDRAFTGKKNVRSFFNDSYEVYNASWTPGLFGEFIKRRGYDLKKYLREFSGTGDPEMTARLKSDYRQTLGELLLEHFTRPWSEWSQQHGALSRNQAHGSPGNLIDLYGAVDIPECEIFGHRSFSIPGMRENIDTSRNVEPNPMMLKLATSAAHIKNKPLISNETFTWLGEHFKVALSQCKPEVEEAFLAGINHVFYHGTTYSPEDASWPGWLFYASVHFGPTNSFWPHLAAMNEYITRCQSILQAGKPDNDVLVYWPLFDIWHDPDGLHKQLSVHNIQEWLHYPGIEKMATAGYSYDFISDALLEQAGFEKGRILTAGGAVTYDALVVPEAQFIPIGTLEKIIELANGGGLVVFEKLPGDVPGFHELERRQKKLAILLDGLHFRDVGNGIMKCETGKGTILICDDPGKALAYSGIQGEKIGASGLQFTRRTLDDGKYYYLVNHTADAIDTLVPLNSRAKTVWIMDPQDGSYGLAQMEPVSKQVLVRVQLKPGQSLFLRTYDRVAPQAPDWIYLEPQLEPIRLDGSWELAFLSGGPVLPAFREMEELEPWTNLEDEAALSFSGTASYAMNFSLPAIPAGEVLLDLGKVYESARVRLNGHDLGPVWANPFEIRVGNYLVEGENRLIIEVANLMANRVRHMDRENIPWRIFHEINFVNIAYEPFDASGWEIEKSGLEGPVRLIPLNHLNQ